MQIVQLFVVQSLVGISGFCCMGPIYTALAYSMDGLTSVVYATAFISSGVATQRHGSTCFHIILTQKERERGRQQRINRDIEESCIIVYCYCVIFLRRGKVR